MSGSWFGLPNTWYSTISCVPRHLVLFVTQAFVSDGALQVNKILYDTTCSKFVMCGIVRSDGIVESDGAVQFAARASTSTTPKDVLRNAYIPGKP